MNYYIIYIIIYKKNSFKIKYIMTITVYYLLLVGFCFALTSGLFISLKSIKLI